MQVNRRMVACLPRKADDALRFSKWIRGDEMAAFRKHAQRIQKLFNLVLRIRVLKNRQTERGLRYKCIARNGYKARAGAVARPLVVPGNDNALTRAFNQNLSTAQNVSGRPE